MRSLKFRAFVKKSKSIFAVRSLDFDAEGNPSSVRLVLPVIGKNGDINFDFPEEKIEDIELDQFTGLKDNKGVIIYENDIVRVFTSRVPEYNQAWQLASQYDRREIEARATIVFRHFEWRLDVDNPFNQALTALRGKETERRVLTIHDQLHHYDFFQNSEFNRTHNLHSHWHKIEVIGNVHENPGLLLPGITP